MSKQRLGGDGKSERGLEQCTRQETERDKASIDNVGEREEVVWGGLMCVYRSLSFFNETVVCFWRRLKLTEALKL